MKHYENECVIWGTSANRIVILGDGFAMESPRTGGEYTVTGSAQYLLSDLDNESRVKLTSWVLEQRRLGNARPEISSNIIEYTKHLANPSVEERSNNILKYFERKSKILGDAVSFAPVMNLTFQMQLDLETETYCELLAHSGCADNTDLTFLLNYLEESGLIKRVHNGFKLQSYIVTVGGYARIAELEKSNVASTRAFVAMWFGDAMGEAWELGLFPAIREAGYEAFRVDQHEHVNKIDDVIIAEIRRSCFVVADFTQGKTGARGGVYYEAGFAHGLDIPVIFTCQQNSIEHLHFDTRQYNHIVWSDPYDLKEQLSNRIAAVIGDGPNKGKDQ